MDVQAGDERARAEVGEAAQCAKLRPHLLSSERTATHKHSDEKGQ